MPVVLIDGDEEQTLHPESHLWASTPDHPASKACSQDVQIGDGYKGNPSVASFEAREEYPRKAFSRSLSKLGGGQILMPLSVEMAFGDVPGMEMALGAPEAGEDASNTSQFSSSSSSPCSMAISMGCAAYANACRGAAAAAMAGSPVFTDAISSLQRYLPSNNEDDDESWPPQSDSWAAPLGDVYSCDEFRMYEFKVRRCMRGRSHDWTECPFAHPGEKARRRDPRRIHYSGTACPDFRKGSCRRGDSCEFAHGVFECWLHPARYRTQPCKDGRNCKRRVCFFAHTSEQLRVLPGSPAPSANSSPRSSLASPSLKAASLVASYDGSPLRQALASSFDGAVECLSCLGHHGFLDLPYDARAASPRAVAAHLSLMNNSGHGVPCGNSSQRSSPTSTLVGHSFSPPPLSPPLSPSDSPPMSPHTPSSWSSAMGRSVACVSAAQASLCQGQASIAASSQNSVSLSPASAHCFSSPSASIPAHRRNLDKLQSTLTLNIPTFEGREAVHMSSVPVPLESHSSQAITDLIANFQQFQLRARAPEASSLSTQWLSKAPSIRHSCQGAQGTCTETRWASQIDPWYNIEGEVDPPLERVESGRDLRAKIYGRLCKENPLENECPDVDWVNEMVK